MLRPLGFPLAVKKPARGGLGWGGAGQAARRAL